MLARMDKDLAFTKAVADELHGEIARQRRNLREVAAAAGVPYVTVGRYMKGERGFPMPVYYALTEALGVNPADLMAAAVRRMEGRQSPPAGSDESRTA